MSPYVSTLILLAIAALALYGMWRGWRGRVARTAIDVPDLATVPDDLGPISATADDVTYVSTTTAADWLNRISASGLGVRAHASVNVAAAGVAIFREGEADVFIPRFQLTSVRLDSGQTGKFMGKDALIVITWQPGPEPLDTALLPRHPSDRVALLAAIELLLEPPTHHNQEDAA